MLLQLNYITRQVTKMENSMYYVYIFIAILYWCNPCFTAQEIFTRSSSSNKYQPMIGALFTNLSTINASIPRGLIRLDRYNQHRQSYTITTINASLIKNFLDEELQRHCIDPKAVTYLVATELTGLIFEQDWQFIRLSNGYGLVIPEDTPSIMNDTKLLFGFAKQRDPAFQLNIKNLSDLLSQPQSEKNQSDLAQYRLAVTKAIVKTISQRGTEAFVQLCKEGAWAYAFEYTALLSQKLSYALLALQYIYGTLSEFDVTAKFQQDLDSYILKSLDAELIQAHIEDLEKQLAASKVSYVSRILSYLPVPQSQLEQRIDIFKKYLDDIKNSFEMQMLPRFLKNKK